MNEHSESNGALMRITPLAVYGYKFPEDEIYELAK
jgi:ADP-ribosylglycohydrolase